MINFDPKEEAKKYIKDVENSTGSPAELANLTNTIRRANESNQWPAFYEFLLIDQAEKEMNAPFNVPKEVEKYTKLMDNLALDFGDNPSHQKIISRAIRHNKQDEFFAAYDAAPKTAHSRDPYHAIPIMQLALDKEFAEKTLKRLALLREQSLLAFKNTGTIGNKPGL